MHNEGGCALAECSCHELVGEVRRASAVPGRLTVSPPCEVHSVELMNEVGQPIYASLSYDNATGCLTVTTGRLP